MKFVGDTLSFSRLSGDGASHTVQLPFYHRAAVGAFAGTRLFALPLPSTNEVILTPINPKVWGDLWRLEAAVSDQPGSAKKLVETLVGNDVNVLVHEGVSESTEDGTKVHQVFEILDLAKYTDDVDGTTTTRNSVDRPLLRPNHLVNRLIANSSLCLHQSRGRDGWEMRFNRMEFFFRNKDARVNHVALSLDAHNEVHVPATVLRHMEFVEDVKRPLPLHIISDTEQKYVKLRVLSPRRYYLLFEIEHAERVGAIDKFLRVFETHDANIIDSYSRLRNIAHSAYFYALAEFSSKRTARGVERIVAELLDSSLAERVVLRGAFGDGPLLDALRLPPGATVRTAPRERPREEARVTADVDGDAEPVADARPPRPSDLGTPYYLDRHGCDGWMLDAVKVFMAIPFGEEYRDLYVEVIERVVRRARLDPLRVDKMPKQARRRPIIDRIEEGIARSRFVIADVTGWNPNVVYEVGLAAAISKPMLILCERRHFNASEIPFDFRGYDLIDYAPTNRRDLRLRLTRAIREMKVATEPAGRGAGW